MTDNPDRIYRSKQPPEPFRFDEKVVAVFPDMIRRSVPGYELIIDQIQSLASRFIGDHSNAYDLGCSLGAASLAMSQGNRSQGSQIIAIDNSQAMVDQCQAFLSAYKHSTPIHLSLGDILEQDIEHASMVVLNFTLQFVPLEQRAEIVKRIYDGLKPGGILVLSEKIRAADEATDHLMIELHHQFKRQQGYSDLEIAQKRNALENVLVPETLQQHFHRLNSAGFTSIDIITRQFNFCCMIAIKNQ